MLKLATRRKTRSLLKLATRISCEILDSNFCPNPPPLKVGRFFKQRPKQMRESENTKAAVESVHKS